MLSLLEQQVSYYHEEIPAGDWEKGWFEADGLLFFEEGQVSGTWHHVDGACGLTSVVRTRCVKVKTLFLIFLNSIFVHRDSNEREQSVQKVERNLVFFREFGLIFRFVLFSLFLVIQRSHIDVHFDLH